MLRSEEIWDALTSDEALAALPDALARACGARSALLLYQSHDASSQALVFNYWPAEQIGLYTRRFAHLDPWRVALDRPGLVNRVHLASAFVPARQFERSVVYNDFVREVGDDTFWCVGACLSTRRGMGSIAVQRGRTAPDFEQANAQALVQLLPQMQQMLMVRGAGNDAAARTLTAERALERLAVGAFLVTASGRVLVANAEAERILDEGDWMTAAGGLRALGPSRAMFERLIAKATARAEQEGGSMLLRSPEGKLLHVDVSPARDPSHPDCAIVSARRITEPNGLETTLKTAFGLTPTESMVAMRLTDGVSAATIADERGVSIQTVRVQIQAVLHKTGFTKTSALAALVGQLSVLGQTRADRS
jgi:DNA-binding CsgD family transcriptional regulator